MKKSLIVVVNQPYPHGTMNGLPGIDLL